MWCRAVKSWNLSCMQNYHSLRWCIVKLEGCCSAGVRVGEISERDRAERRTDRSLKRAIPHLRTGRAWLNSKYLGCGWFCHCLWTLLFVWSVHGFAPKFCQCWSYVSYNRILLLLIDFGVAARSWSQWMLLQYSLAKTLLHNMDIGILFNSLKFVVAICFLVFLQLVLDYRVNGPS